MKWNNIKLIFFSFNSSSTDSNNISFSSTDFVIPLSATKPRLKKNAIPSIFEING